MDQFKELRAHPKMTKALLEQIESLQKQNHTTDEISATLGITPESVQRGYEKLNDKHRAEIRAKRGGAFAVNVKEEKPAWSVPNPAAPGAAAIENTVSGRLASSIRFQRFAPM